MKRILFLALWLGQMMICPNTLTAQTGGSTVGTAQTYAPTVENLASRQDFSNRRFGIFLHWGLYSLFGQGEWFMNNQDIAATEYAKAANAFYPHDFDAKAWMHAIREAGAGYVCFTTRHHDGFSMWHTDASDYHIGHTPFQRDVLAELAEAAHEEGLRLHLYYSHIDWTRPDYPSGRTGLGTGRDTSKQNWPAYYDFMNRQLTELLTRYGEVGAIWFDGWWDHVPEEAAVQAADAIGGAAAAPRDSLGRLLGDGFDWQLDEQYALIHRLQPACLVGNNHHQFPFPGEDIQIFERDVPGENEHGLSGQAVGNVLPLETCQTMNGMWGYKVKDQNYKSTAELLRLLIRTSAKGANLLLNIGPQPDGNLPAAALERLKGMGEWLRANGETIYSTQAGGIKIGEEIVSTRRGDVIYLHCIGDEVPAQIALPAGVKVKSAVRYSDGLPLAARGRGNGRQQGQIIFLPDGGEKNEVDYIIELRVKS